MCFGCSEAQWANRKDATADEQRRAEQRLQQRGGGKLVMAPEDAAARLDAEIARLAAYMREA
jgi:hypothetical protein